MPIVRRLASLGRNFIDGVATPFRLMWEQRGLLRLLIRREMVGRTSGTSLGSAWMLVQPALQMLGMWFFLVIVLQVRSPGRVPFVNYFLVGMVAWTMLSEILQRNLTVLVEFGTLYQRTIFPLPLLPLLPLLVSGAIYGTVLVVVAGVMEGPVAAAGAALGILLLLIWLVPISYGLAVLGLFVKEARQVVPFALTMLMYVTPILYMPEQLPSALRTWSALNPLADIVALLHAIVQGEPWSLGNLVRPLIIWLVLTPAAWMLFKRTEPHMREAL